MGYIQEYLDQISEEQLCEDYLRQALRGSRKARPYGCRKYFGIKGETEYIGTLRDGKWLMDIYEDERGDYWFAHRVMIGKWVITSSECLRGRKDPDDPYEKHTGIRSDWDKVQKKYGGVPPGWERIRPEDQEEEYVRDKGSSVDKRAVKGTAGYKKAI